MNEIRFDVNYYANFPKPRHFSHKYGETWKKVELFCPNCGTRNVWEEQSGGDYYVGCELACTACANHFTIQGPYEGVSDQDKQRMEHLRAAVSAGVAPSGS